MAFSREESIVINQGTASFYIVFDILTRRRHANGKSKVSVLTYLRIQCRGTRHLDFVLFCTSSFMGRKGTYFNDSLVVKASGGQTLTMLYI